MGEDSEIEKTGSVLNRVTKCGVATASRSRRTRDNNRITQPCNVDQKENNGGSEGSKGENHCEQGQRQTKHDWDGAGDGGDKNRVQMTNDERDERDDTNDSQAQVVTSRSTEHSWRASVTCHKIEHISSLRQREYAVRWQTRQRLTWNVSRGSGDTSLGSREQSAGCAGRRVVSWKAMQTPIGEATKPLDDRCQPESS